MRIVQRYAIAQGQSAVSEGNPGGFSRNSRSHSGRLSAGRLRQGRDWHGLVDRVDRFAWAADDADPGRSDPGGAVTDHQYLAGCGRRRNIQTCVADVATARRHLHGYFIRRAAATHDGNGRATVWLGLALAAYAALGLVKGQFSVPRHAEVWLGLLMGTATGAITVATGIFVMPGTPYLQALAFERDKMVQALGVSFTTSTITLALALAHAW